jgi:uncharacterized protein YbjT (DUF2867 family)
MKVLLFGATGMVGQGALRECRLDPDVTEVLAIGRTPTGVDDPKLREITHADFLDFDPIAGELAGFDACLFCLGVSSAGMNEQAYTRITYDVTIAAARAVLVASPDATFIYVSGAGTDTSESGRSMWARVKGKTENDLLSMTPKAYMFRPGIILPVHGVVSKTPLYRGIYAALRPLNPLLRRAPSVTTSEQVGRAMLAVAKHGASTHVLDNKLINTLATE